MAGVLVSGATGFIGSHLVRRLAGEGTPVHALLREGSDASALAALGSTVTLHRHDATTDGLMGILADTRPETVYHLAARFVAEHQTADIVPLIESNLLFATQLAEAAVAVGVRNFVNVGTAWEHFEDGDDNPVCLYAATKHAVESILRFYVEARGLRVVTLKLFDSYGPKDPRRKLFAILREAAASGERLALSPGAQLIELVYIDDIVEALIVAARRLTDGEVEGMERYAVSSGNPLPLRELVETWARVTGKVLNIDWGARPYRAREVMVPWRTGARLPRWRLAVSLEDGIARMEAEPV
jgi:nucleoside-diphosphate-sugar epimerase